ncbi:MAG: hypothetical protein KatS3mg009_0012 [Acidimicrobiia bacterium]|nr:MAG: hypothetical protein KatS3mg009_0012 [Acidimicrobiia bacterium]
MQIGVESPPPAAGGRGYLTDPAPGATGDAGGSRLRTALVTLDATASAVAWTLAGTVVGGWSPGRAALLGAVCASVTVCLAGARHLYRARNCLVQTEELAALLRVGALTGIIGGALAGWAGEPRPGRVAAAGAAGAAAALACGRTLYRHVLTEARRAGRHHRRVVIVGGGDDARNIAALLDDHPELGFTVVGCVAPAHGANVPQPVLGTVEQLAAVAAEHGVDGVVVATGDLTQSERVVAVRRAHAAGLHVQLPTAYPGIDRRRLVHHHLMHVPFAYVEPPGSRTAARAAKRALDLVVATFALALTAPVWVVVAAAIKLDDGGPVFFSQERVGLHRRTFRFRKFRTMVPGAEGLVGELLPHNTRRGGPLFKADHDPRVTRVGRFLRATSLDELPQLLNVLTGDMSVVGPRPPLPREVEHFDEELMARFDVRPGITGLWQLRARDNAAFSAYRRLDLHYVQNWSLTFDLAIIVATLCELAVRPFAHRARARVARPSLAVVPGGEPPPA